MITIRFITAVMLTHAATLGAIERSQVLDRYQLVGVISESKDGQSGIVVIRDIQRKKSLTLRSGDKVNGNLTIKAVRRNQVVLASESDQFMITYAGSKVEDKQPAEEPNLEKLYEQQMKLLEDQNIDANEVIHVFEDGVYKSDDKKSDRTRLWRPVRTGDNLKYVIKQEASGNDSNEAVEGDNDLSVLDQDYED